MHHWKELFEIYTVCPETTEYLSLISVQVPSDMSVTLEKSVTNSHPRDRNNLSLTSISFLDALAKKKNSGSVKFRTTVYTTEYGPRER